MTSKADREILLSLARVSIQKELYRIPGIIDTMLLANTKTPAGSGGAFVTLKIAGNLRGCIGRLTSDSPITETVSQMAVSAAFSDPRFPPLKDWEFDQICIEISRLSAFFPIRAEDVIVGKHGLLLSLGRHSGLLLPQVPVEQNWNREDFLAGLCSKAGVPERSWESPGAILEGFTAEVFSESEP